MELSLNEIIHGVVFEALEYTPENKAMIVFDEDCGLTTMLTEAYKAVLPEAILVDFNKQTPDEIKAAIDLLAPKDLVVMVQSTSFRLNEFRFRLELFNRSLKVIEHPHLGRIPEVEWPTYIKALEYDKEYYRTVGPAIKAQIDKAQRIVVSCNGAELVYDTPMEDAKLNIGDYTGMKNTGGQFPIGEVFTEPTNMSGVNGTVKLFAFGDNKFRVISPEQPVLVVIKEGIIVDAPDAPPEFVDILDQIKMDEQLWVRELGFGMNRAMTRDIRLTDIGSYERMCGIHLSLGQKHTIYAKPGFPKRSSRYHVDVFVDVTQVTIDAEVVFKDGKYLV